MQAIILLGAPGAGKGTLAEGVRNATDYIHVSTGDMLRAAIKAGSQTGLEAKAFMDKGELVPDSVIMRIVSERLAQGQPTDKYMFDGFPRTLEQARQLDEVLAKLGSAVNQVFLLEVPTPVIVSRLSGRRICKTCGAVYHVTNIPPKKEGICDQCGGPLYQRPDDEEATVLNRLDVYQRQTASLIDFYDQKGILIRINAGTNPQAATAELLAKLA
ncbi:MAG TPA: adenylate kinase [Kiritimatiellia bacterium]|jgi:adenylate kinase|nr:adenylate kinase [Kiritimatiellia bacterium]HOE00347.1 adenylate kinase [Kiritimatiellia bacterium]HOE36832.1 adenylate kinase [Kiritimatiellia bacterium]HOR73382.1 adenylate kinase [Kiritimatiellia bacterium]HOU57931.1 adenylate kinase [Kiritimatiellia bacterium]